MNHHLTSNPRALVVGAGVAGVTIIADRFQSSTTSVIAGALWEWPPAVCGYYERQTLPNYQRDLTSNSAAGGRAGLARWGRGHGPAMVCSKTYAMALQRDDASPYAGWTMYITESAHLVGCLSIPASVGEDRLISVR
jgi:hypothetical protein